MSEYEHAKLGVAWPSVLLLAATQTWVAGSERGSARGSPALTLPRLAGGPQCQTRGPHSALPIDQFPALHPTPIAACFWERNYDTDIRSMLPPTVRAPSERAALNAQRGLW